MYGLYGFVLKMYGFKKKSFGHPVVSIIYKSRSGASIYLFMNGASIYLSIQVWSYQRLSIYMPIQEWSWYKYIQEWSQYLSIYMFRNGAGMLDLTWLTGNTLLSCGYDTCARLWDTRCHNLTDFTFWRELNFFVYFLLHLRSAIFHLFSLIKKDQTNFM